MKKFVAALLVLVMSCFSVGYAEQVPTACPCLCCQGTPATDDNSETEPMTYEEWFEYAYPLLKNCYNLSTWVKVNNATTYTTENRGMWIYVDASFLLLDDIRCANAEQIELIYDIVYSNPHRDSKNIINMYKFIQSAQSVCEILRTSHSKVNVPEEYEEFDNIFMRCISQIENMHGSIVAYIKENGTTENWVKSVGTLEDDMKRIELLYCFIE